MTPTISFLMPTHREDRPLRRALNSIAPQLQPGDEVVVIGDTHDGELPGVQATVKEYGYQFRYLSLDAGHHCWGHCQLDYALMQARTDYIHCSDDDDIWTPHAAEAMRHAAKVNPGEPALFRFVSFFGTVYWERAGLFERNHLGGHCLFLPNDPERIGKFYCGYSGDFDYVHDTVQAYGGPERVAWRDDIVCIARPTTP